MVLPKGPERPLPQASASAHRHTACADVPVVAPVASPVTSSGSNEAGAPLSGYVERQ